MDIIIHWLQTPWPWYVAGPIIGLMVPLMIWIGNRSFGISSNLRHLCAISQPKSIGVDFFQYNWREHSWSLVFAIGAVIGGFLGGVVFANPEPIALSVDFLTKLAYWNIPIGEGFLPPVLFGLYWQSFVIMFLGGVLVGFGTRYANGCTSGHAITGLSTLQPQSLLAVLGIFAGGLLAAHFITPNLIGGITP
jgi:uncharacterized membrane protein YedE/YeeE